MKSRENPSAERTPANRMAVRKSPLLRWLPALLAVAPGYSGCTPYVLGYEVVKAYPHDGGAYTQGLLWHAGKLYESTGRYGVSSFRRCDLKTGEVEKKVDLPENLFGEGLTWHNGLFYQLTWTGEQCRVYDAKTMEFKKTLPYKGEGWGLTSDGERLIMSDGTDLLSYRDPKTFDELRRVRVREGKKKLLEINELEYIPSGPYKGEIWANVWKSMAIARIAAKSGEIIGWIDLTGIFDNRRIQDEDAVLNGIAFDAVENRVFVTGKLWPKLFWIRVK
jgi:glutamine cyclotransferase